MRRYVIAYACTRSFGADTQGSKGKKGVNKGAQKITQEQHYILSKKRD